MEKENEVVKTKFVVIFEKKFLLTSEIAEIVANHNGGEANVSLIDIRGFIKGNVAKFPSSLGDARLQFGDDKHTLNVWVGDDLVLTIDENEIWELKLDTNEQSSNN